MSEIATLLKSKDWSSHPLGAYEDWPPTLKAALRIMLESRFPKLLFWGEDFFCFYNDAFRPSLGTNGKHPSSFGQPHDEAYPETKHSIRPIMNNVMTTGVSTYFTDQLLPIYRNGQLSEAYWTFSHSPLRDESDKIVGIFVDCIETHVSNSDRKLPTKENQDFRSLADSISQPVFATDNQGGITYANRSFLEYTGKTLGQLQDFGWNSIIPEEDLEDVMNGWMAAIKNTVTYSTEIRYKRHDDQIRYFLANVVPVLDANGNVARWVGSAADIQALKDQETEKDMFIGMASHELKTPVTSIKGYVQLLQKMYQNSDDAFLTGSLQTLDKQVKSLTKLIGDMLDLSKIKTGNLELDLDLFSIDDLINEAIDELSHVNPNHQFIYTEISCERIYGDKDRIAQVLINFLTNAIKYAPESNKITISCTSSEGKIRVSVIDKGVGLTTEERARVFERFYRSEGKDQGTFPGFGIGLYIAADIIQRHNGTIGVESQLSEGSTFFFELPSSKAEVQS